MTKGKVAERERGKDDKTEEEGSKVNGRSLPFFFFLHLPRPLLIYYVVSQELGPESRHVSFYFTWPFIFLSIFFSFLRLRTFTPFFNSVSLLLADIGKHMTRRKQTKI